MEAREELESAAQEMVELYGELQESLKNQGCKDAPQKENPRAGHLGYGVYVQRNEYGIDRDSNENSPVTITRQESRSAVKHALDALQTRFAVCVTGQTGIGKTRGCMMHAIQALLFQAAAVLYVGYKSQEILLFLPGEDGKYQVWWTYSDDFKKTLLKHDKRVVAVIDPPGKGPYLSEAACRVLKFVSNNAEIHFQNWEKDGIILVISMPIKKEVIAMTSVLWDKRTPHSWQARKEMSVEEKEVEVEKRVNLVGPIPRLVFNSQLLRRAIIDCLSDARKLAESLSDLELYEAMLGRYTPFVSKHPASVTGKLLHLLPEPIDPKSWEERMEIGIEPALKLTALPLPNIRCVTVWKMI